MDLTKLPIDIKFAYNRNSDLKIEDSKTFPPMTNKVETIGKIRPKTFLIQCDGNKTLTFKELNSAYERLKSIKKLLSDGLITKQDYDKKKDEILQSI